MERRELVRASDAPSELLRVDVAEVGVVATSAVELVTTPLGGLAFGGTSWTCRLSGWLDFDGGGRTKINVWRMVSVNGKTYKNRIAGSEQAEWKKSCHMDGYEWGRGRRNDDGEVG